VNSSTIERAEARLAWKLVAPAIVLIAAIAVIPLAWTLWESLHLHDLRMPWLGRPVVGLANYGEALSDPRFREALAHTMFFTSISVPLQLLLGLILAVGMSRATRGRGLLRVSVLLPWSIPTVVVALLWRFMFDSQSGIVNAMLSSTNIVPDGFAWFVQSRAAWVPVILADVWKMTPFVALLLLAGLESIDQALYEAARLDGATAWQQFTHITLPLLRPAMTVAVLFRTLDGLRVFDLIFVLTGGGPGTATEPISLYTFTTLLQNLRFGFGSALAILTFLMTFGFALAYIRLFARELTEPAK
jgi:ABC-type sugar transport system permease subunit